MKPAPEEPMSESLRDVEDLSLKFSIDVDFKANGEMDMARRQHELVEILSRKANSINKPIVSYSPGRRKVLYVVATDCYNSNGSPTETLSLTVKNIMQVARSRSSQIGLLFLTGLCLQETKEVVNSCPTNLEDFDALICSSGSEIYYPWKDLGLDDDYEAHIEYRWPGENIKSAVMRLGKIEEGSEHDIAQCPSASSFQCYSYSIKPGAEVRKVNDLRQRLRMRGFRCNVVYTHAASRLNVTPLFASRSQALRYLSVRWGVDLSSMVVFVGGKGDTDYESLLVGLHKTVILKRSVEYASEKLLHNEDSFKTDEIVPPESTNICAAEGYEPQDISAALEKLGVM